MRGRILRVVCVRVSPVVRAARLASVAFVALVAPLAFTGCRTALVKLYHGQSVSVTLDSEPRGATAYLVPLSEWTRPDGTTLLSDPERLENYRVREGVTPVTVSRVMHRFEYVAVLGDKKNHSTITPGMVAKLPDGRTDTALLSLVSP